MTDLILLSDSQNGLYPDAEYTRNLIESEDATVVSVHVPSVLDDQLNRDEFSQVHHQHGIDLANIHGDFRLKDILLVKTPKEGTPLNFILLHFWNWPTSTYDIDAVRIPHEGSTDPRNNPKGKNPGNIWAFSESLNDRGKGKQTKLIVNSPSDTIVKGHLETDALERLIKCHTETKDRIHFWGGENDYAKIAEIANALGRTSEKIPSGSHDSLRNIPVITEEYPIQKIVDESSLQDLQGIRGEFNDAEAKYFICDCRLGIKHLPDDSIDDVITSPPYNIAYDPFNVPKPDPSTGELRSPLRQGYDDEMPAEKYHYLLESTFNEINDKLDSHSSDIFVNIKNNYSGGDCRPPFWLLELIPTNWSFSDLLVWRYDISYDPAKNKYKPYYEWIFRFTKGSVNRPDDHNFLQDYYIPILKGNSRERQDLTHPAIYPKDLVKTCLSLSNHSGLVLDPFLGSGTTMAAAKEEGRPSVGFEIEGSFEEDIRKRLERATVPSTALE